jgi:hypothetical protein
MQLTEHHPESSGPEQMISYIVELMRLTHRMELALTSPVLGAPLNSVEPTFLRRSLQTHSHQIELNKAEINMYLLELDGIPCRYDDTQTKRSVESRFIAWNGLVRGRTDQHLWRPKHAQADITVSTTFLEELSPESILRSVSKVESWRNPDAYR